MKRIAVFLILFLMYSCETNFLSSVETVEFAGEVIETSTNKEGELKILSENFNNENEYDIEYEMQVIDQDGNPIPYIEITYGEINGKSIILVSDPSGKYTSAVLYGTPFELRSEFSSNASLYDEFGENVFDSSNLKSTNSITLLTIGLLVTLGSIAWAEVNIILNAYEIQEFYLTDVMDANDEYITYCKDFTEIADLIRARTEIVLNAASIVVSFASGSTLSPTIKAWEIKRDVILTAGDKLRDFILAQAIESWGVRMDEIIDKKVTVKVYPYDEDDAFSNIKNLYAVYVIEEDNDLCNGFINDIPIEVNDFLDDELIETLEEAGLVIHTGFNPPDVTGNFYLDSWSNKETDYQYMNYSYQFLNQTENLNIEVNSQSDKATANGFGGFISGEYQSFSIYCETDQYIYDEDHEVYIKTADIYSGTVSTAGISNFENGFIIVEKENDIYDNYMAVGETRVVYEKDGMGDRVSTYPYNPGTKYLNNNISKHAALK